MDEREMTTQENAEERTGGTAPDAGEQEKDAEEGFEALIRGKYKEEFDARVRRILDGRLRGLRQENAELEALCEQARANSLLPPVPPQPRVLEQPGLPVIVFHPAADAPKAEQPQPDAVPEQEPAPQAAPPEPEEERCPFAQPDWKPTTALDHQAVDLVHQLESLMTV